MIITTSLGTDSLIYCIIYDARSPQFLTLCGWSDRYPPSQITRTIFPVLMHHSTDISVVRSLSVEARPQCRSSVSVILHYPSVATRQISNLRDGKWVDHCVSPPRPQTLALLNMTMLMFLCVTTLIPGPLLRSSCVLSTSSLF